MLFASFINSRAIPAFMVGLTLAATSPIEAGAGAGVINHFGHNYLTWHHDDGSRTEFYDDNGDIYAVFFDANGEYEGWHDINEGDPNPDDNDSGIGPDKDAIIEALKKLGGAPYAFNPEFWLTPIGRDLAEGGIGGFTATDPPPEYDPGGLGYEHDEGFGGGGNGGFDPMGGGLK